MWRLWQETKLLPTSLLSHEIHLISLIQSMLWVTIECRIQLQVMSLWFVKRMQIKTPDFVTATFRVIYFFTFFFLFCSYLIYAIINLNIDLMNEKTANLTFLLYFKSEKSQVPNFSFDGRCPSFDSSPLSLGTTPPGGKFSAAIWSAGGVPRITNFSSDCFGQISIAWRLKHEMTALSSFLW